MVQGVMATDLKGLGLLKQEGVLLCHHIRLQNQQKASI